LRINPNAYNITSVSYKILRRWLAQLSGIQTTEIFPDERKSFITFLLELCWMLTSAKITSQPLPMEESL